MTFTFVTEAPAVNQALFQVTHGLYVLTAAVSNRKNGQCLDALMQVTNAPPRIVIGVGTRSLTHEMIRQSGRFAISVLDRTNLASPEVVRRFGFQSGRDADKFSGFRHEVTAHGIPYLPTAVAVFECTVLQEKTTDLSTHSLFVGSVDRAGTREGGEPLTYNEYRRTMRQGRSPENG